MYNLADTLDNGIFFENFRILGENLYNHKEIVTIYRQNALSLESIIS